MGASKPVSHMSRTMTIWNGSSGSLKRLGQGLAPRLVADVRLPLGRVRGRAGHHDLDSPRVVVLVVPVGPQLARCSSYRSTQMRRLMQTTIALPSIASSARLEVLDEVLGDERSALLGADHRLELRPLAS